MADRKKEDYEALQEIGRGSFGIIRKVKRKTDSAILCRKEICYGRMSEREKQQLRAEIDILSALRHPNIVQYYHREHIKDSQDLYLYMEYCGNGDLGGYIKRLKDGGRLADEEFVWNVFAQLVGALYRCHYGEDAPAPGQEGGVRKGKALQSKEGHRVILHRDLKPENVFLGQNNAVKLGDFGLSKIIASHDFASTYVGTPFYMSPEICAAERYSHHSDVWSLGCIIYELATRCVPFDARSHVELVMKIKNGRIKPLPEMYSKDLTDVISWCLKVDPSKRPDTAQLLNVLQIRTARTKLEQGTALEKAQQDRDAAVSKLNVAMRQIQELQEEVGKLREAGKKVEMEWHAKATLAIDQRVEEAKREQERQKADFQTLLQKQFDAAVEERVEEKLNLHKASLPQSHGLGAGAEIAVHVRSSTPPPGKPNASFATTATTGVGSDGSSVAQEHDDATLETDISSLSILEDGEDVSPLAQRVKPPPKAGRRLPFGRAKTLANCNFENTASPMDVQMADPSPMPNHVAPMSIKGLSLSPRRHGQDRLSGAGMRKNIFMLANNEQKLRPAVGNEENSSFADDDLDDDDTADSPSRPSSGASNHANGDPFKAFAAPPQRLPRPSLARQQTMPTSVGPAIHSRQRSNVNIFTGLRGNKPSSPEREKENRPPSSSGRVAAAVPVMTASPKRAPVAGKDGKVLTPSRKAPPPPPSNVGLPRAATAQNLAKLAHANNFPSPGKGAVKGRTLVELQQARQLPLPSSDSESDGMGFPGAVILPSPAKWSPSMGDDMPSPFLAKKGRMMR